MASLPITKTQGGIMHERLKSIKAIAKTLKLRLPFEPDNDNMHDLLDGIVALCDEPVFPHVENPIVKPDGVQWSINPKAIANSNDTTKMTSYLLNDKWLSVGIPKRQPFHEQVFWAANKGATKIKMEHDGEENEILINQL